MIFQCIEGSPSSSEENMKKDEELLKGLSYSSSPVLHFHSWKGIAATYGYFISPERFFYLEKLKDQNIDIAKRPTGGGVIFHHTALSFALLIPASHPYYSLNTMDNYRAVNRHVIEAISRFLDSEERIDLLEQSPVEEHPLAKNYCMAHPTKYDVFFQGKKIGGAAQRRTKNGFLHQGTISIALPNRHLLEEVLVDGELIADKFLQNGHSLLSEGWSQNDLEEARRLLKSHLKKTLTIQIEG